LKLRIPLYVFLLGTVSGIYQYFHEQINNGNTTFLYGLIFYILLGIAVFILEKTEFIKRIVNPLIGIVIIALGFLIDFYIF
jgi:arginine exporter protein ArgO